jgi:ABC-type phosphate transport system permease subunit
VLVFPKPGSGYSVATAEVDVVKGRDERWRVDYWMITKFHGPGSAAASDSPSALSEGPPKVHKLPGSKAAKRDAAVEAATTGSRADALWLAVPLAVLALIVVLPISIGIAVWLRNRRAAAEWHRSKA